MSISDHMNCPHCKASNWVTSRVWHCKNCGREADTEIYAPSGMSWQELAKLLQSHMLAWELAADEASMPSSEEKGRKLQTSMREQGHNRQASLIDWIREHRRTT